MGAAGRDFHNFNTYFKDNSEYEVVGFTATQIPDIYDRKYPTELAGKLYPNGIPIYDEKNLTKIIKENNIDGSAYAVDTWEGEEHTGKYDESVFESVQSHARKEYMGFAYLMRMLFQDAIHHFDNETIELLHIDGLHSKTKN